MAVATPDLLSMTDAPLVSAIIPTHNGAKWIGETLSSVFSQTYKHLEIVVIDDGSTDSTPELLGFFGERIKVTRTSAGNIGAARNAGISQSTGEYVAFLDHDDLWAHDKIAKQVAHLNQHSELAALYTDADEFDENGTDAKSFFGKFPALAANVDAASMIVDQAVPLMSTLMLRRSFIDAHKIRFHEAASGVDEISLLLEVYYHGGKMGFLPERLAQRRLHSQNLSKDHLNRFSKRILVYSDLLRRLPEDDGPFCSVIRRGLRHASFRVGEWYWGDLRLPEARRYLAAAVAPDRIGFRSAVLWPLTYLPIPVIRLLRAAKSAVTRGVASTHPTPT